MDWTVLNTWIAQSLNGSDITQLDSWTQTELYQYAEEALHDIGGRLMLIAEKDDSTALAASQTIYPTPAEHIVTIYAAADGVTLAPSSVSDMEALDDDWTEAAAAAAPSRWVGNALGLGFIGVYPPKNASGTLNLVFQKHPPDMPVPAAGQPLEIKMPAAVGDYLTVKTLEQARTRQGDGQMMDAADAFNALGQLYEQAMGAYWGVGS